MEQILKYQQLDSQILKLERQLKNSEEKKIMGETLASFKQLQNKSLQLENLASKLASDYENIKKDYDACFALLKKVTDVKSESLSEKELAAATKQVNEISSQFFMIERKLNQTVLKMKEVLKEFETIKNNIIKARAKHKESKLKYESLEKNILPEVEKAKAEMDKIASSVNKNLMDKYKSKKADNIFPVFVGLSGSLCGACHMEQPKAKIDELKKEGIIVCEHCGRIIYNK